MRDGEGEIRSEVVGDEPADDEGLDPSRSILYLALPLTVLPATIGVLLSRPLLGGRVLDLLSSSGSLPWIELVAISMIVFSVSYLATRHRYSLTYSAAGATLLSIAIYSAAQLYAAAGLVDADRFLLVTRWSFWALPLALASWLRTVLLAVDEALQSGGELDDRHPRIAPLLERWRERRVVSRRVLLGELDMALYALLGLVAAATMIQPHWLFHPAARQDPWHGWQYTPTGWGIAAAGIAIGLLSVAAIFVSFVWLAKPRGIAFHDEARLHLVGTGAWLAVIASLFALGSSSLWPKPLLHLAFAMYFFGLAAAMVHAAFTQERFRRYTTPQRRIAGGVGTITFSAAVAATILPDRLIRATALSSLIAGAAPLTPIAVRAMFGFERPPAKEHDEVKLVEVVEVEEAALAAALRDLMAGGASEIPISPMAVKAMYTFAAGLHEASSLSEKPHREPSPRRPSGRPSSDLRHIFSDKRRVRLRMLPHVESLPAFAGTPNERLDQLAKLIQRTAIALLDPQGQAFEMDEPTGPPTRIHLLLAYSLVTSDFPELGSEDERRRRRYVYQAWIRARGSWTDLENEDLDTLKRLATKPADKEKEDERRRRLASRHLDHAAADVRQRWLINLERYRSASERFPPPTSR